jgi:hypothetical protein
MNTLNELFVRRSRCRSSVGNAALGAIGAMRFTKDAWLLG